MSDDIDFDIRSGEVETKSEFVLTCEGCGGIRYNPTPLVVFEDGNHYYSHWCDECREKRTAANIGPDPTDESTWDFAQFDEEEEQCACNNAEHSEYNYECPLNEEVRE